MRVQFPPLAQPAGGRRAGRALHPRGNVQPSTTQRTRTRATDPRVARPFRSGPRTIPRGIIPGCARRRWTMRGEFPERSKGLDCKSSGSAFAGSNPALPSTRSAGSNGGLADLEIGISARNRRRPWLSVGRPAEGSRPEDRRPEDQRSEDRHPEDRHPEDDGPAERRLAVLDGLFPTSGRRAISQSGIAASERACRPGLGSPSSRMK